MRQASAFVTGASGLLGNNLVRLLLSRGYRVKALVRSMAKGRAQFADLVGGNLELIQGDVTLPAGFQPHLAECSVLFHAAAYFRESYQGGKHSTELQRVNVSGTRFSLASYWKQRMRWASVGWSMSALSPYSVIIRRG